MSTIAMSQLRCLNQYGLVPRKDVANLMTLFEKASPSLPIIYLSSCTVSSVSKVC